MTMCQKVSILLLYFSATIAREYLNVLVNRMEHLSSAGPFTTDRPERNSLYHYIDGDRVDVMCISLTKLCTATIKYNRAENFSVDGHSFEMSSAKHDGNGVGLLTTLTAAHNHTITSCNFSCSGYKITLKITFVLQIVFNALDLKINGFALRYDRPDTVIYYHYFDNEVLSIDWKMNIKGAELETFQEQWGTNDLYFKELNGTHTEIIANTVYGIKYNIHNKTTDLNKLRVYFQKLNGMPRDETPLAANTSGSSLELYQYNGDQQIYYEFKYGDSMTFSCYTAPQFLVTSGNYKLQFGSKDTWDEDQINKRILFTSNDREFDCCLVNTEDKVVRRIRLHFHKNDSPHNRDVGGSSTTITTSTRHPTSTTSAPMIISTAITDEEKSYNIKSEDDSPNWVLPAVAGVVGIVVITTIAVWYMKKRNHRTLRDQMQTHLVDNGTLSSPNLRQQEPLYSVPLDQRQDDTAYCEVYRPEAYSAGSTIQAKGMTPELNYAELDLSPSVRIAKKPDAVESPYAEVIYNAKARWRTDQT